MQNKIVSLVLILGVLSVGIGQRAVAQELAPVPVAEEVPVAEIVSAPVATPEVGQGAEALAEEAVREENKRRLEEELSNTVVSDRSLVDFPNRASLGSLELAPLPGINDAGIDGPQPMAPSVSGKDFPSEQLLGRITPEVFQEMADLERGNTFLKLQMEKERLKNDLENLKATYRQKRLDEIAKREDVVRTRIQWWQEQEKIRLELEKKQAEEEELNRKIAEQEAERDQLREEAKQRAAAAAEAAAASGETISEEALATLEAGVPAKIEELYTINRIFGIGTELKARLESKEDGTIVTVKQDDILPSGHVVREIKKEGMTVAFGDQTDQLAFRPVTQ